MDKADADRIKLALTKLDRNPFFVYAPAKRGLFTSPTLEFLLTAGQRESRVAELRQKFGDKVVKGRVEEAETGELTFRTVAAPTKTFATDMKKMGQKIPKLAKITIAAADDKTNERDDGGTSEASTRATAKLQEEANVAGKVDARLAGIKDPALKERVTKALDRLPRAAEAVAKLQARYEKANSAEFRSYGKVIFGSFTDLFKDGNGQIDDAVEVQEEAAEAVKELKKKVDLAKKSGDVPEELAQKFKTATEQAEKAKYKVGEAQGSLQTVQLGKGELEELWGRIAAQAKSAGVKVTAAVTLVAQAVEARDKAKASKELAKFADLVQKAVTTIHDADPDVRKIEEAIAVFQRRANDITGLAPVKFVEVVDLADDGTDASPKAPAKSVLERAYATFLSLIENPLTDEIALKAGIVRTLRTKALTPIAAKPTDKNPPPTPQETIDVLASLVMVTKRDAATLSGEVNALTTTEAAVALTQALSLEPGYGSAAVSQHLKAAQEWLVVVDSLGGSDRFAKKVSDANLGTAGGGDVRRLVALAGVDDDSLREAFGSIEYPDEPGKLGPVRVTESTKVIVVGGGPVGLMAAIEARLKGSKVTVFEGRPDPYSRQNVLKIDGTTSTRLSRYGVGKELGVVKEGGDVTYGAIPVAKLEDALSKRAEALGVGFVRGLHVTEIDSDLDTGEVLVSLSGRPRPEAAALAIIAVGAGINAKNRHAGNIVMAEQLGIKIDTFQGKDYAAAAVFKQGVEVNDEESDLDDKLAWEVTLKTPESKYKLTQLSASEWAQVKDDKDALMKLVLGRVKGDGVFKDTKLDNVGRFEIVVQRAESMVSSKGSAVIVGDSVATPHPNTGSGTNTGANEVTIVGDLVRDFVLAARQQRGGNEARAKALDNYNTEMGKVAAMQSEKGIQETLRLRKDRVRRLARQINDLRATFDPSNHKPEGTKQLQRFWKEKVTAGAELEQFATVDVSQGKAQWKAAEDVIVALDKIEGKMLEVFNALKNEKAADQFETRLDNGLSSILLKV
jgi:2-polyprenyl-6-methoxyphenol hydroxylase-like FAD-dependent oxidoreductase